MARLLADAALSPLDTATFYTPDPTGYLDVTALNA